MPRLAHPKLRTALRGDAEPGGTRTGAMKDYLEQYRNISSAPALGLPLLYFFFFGRAFEGGMKMPVATSVG